MPNPRKCDDRCVHYGADGETRVIWYLQLDRRTVSKKYYAEPNRLIILPKDAGYKNLPNLEKFLHDINDGRLKPQEGRFVAYKDGIYRGNLDNGGVLYVVACEVIHGKNLDVFKVPKISEGETIDDVIDEAIISQKKKAPVKERKEPRLRTHSYL